MKHQRVILTLSSLRRIFRLVGEIRELGAEPSMWRPHLLKRLSSILHADLVVSSEVHFRTTGTPDVLRVDDIGWILDRSTSGEAMHVHTQRLEKPEAFWVALCGQNDHAQKERVVAVKPTQRLRSGGSFILSQFPLTHLGAVDQLGLHRYDTAKPFTPSDHKLVRLFHVELGRLWNTDALHKAADATTDLPPRLTQTLEGLLQGNSEKQIAFALGLSQHTVHHYVQALHKRFGVASRAELLAKANQQRLDFRPRLSVDEDGTLPGRS
jgi:hypothetical protein